MLPLQDTPKNASEKCGSLIQKSSIILKILSIALQITLWNTLNPILFNFDMSFLGSLKCNVVLISLGDLPLQEVQ